MNPVNNLHKKILDNSDLSEYEIQTIQEYYSDPQRLEELQKIKTTHEDKITIARILGILKL